MGGSKKTKILIIILVIILITLQYKLWFGGSGLIQTIRLKSAVRVQKAKNAALLENNEGLSKEIDALKSSGETIEDRARTELGMVKKGEVFYQVMK